MYLKILGLACTSNRENSHFVASFKNSILKYVFRILLTVSKPVTQINVTSIETVKMSDEKNDLLL